MKAPIEQHNPYVFIVGCPRSGTTLLQRMLDSHPDLSVANDTHFIPRIIEKESEMNPILSGNLIEKIIHYHRFPRLGILPDRVRELAGESETYCDLIHALYTDYGAIRGKKFAGEKTPDYVKHLPMLHQMFSSAKIVHIIRDGRDTTLSILQWSTEEKGPAKFKMWQEEPVAISALWWKSFVTKGIDDSRLLGNDVYHEVHYEDLVAFPEPTLRILASFLNLPFSLKMVRYYEGKIRPQAGLSAKKAWLPPTPNLRDWKKEMSSRDLELFEAIAGDLLMSLGYPRAYPTISSEVLATALRIEKQWLSEVERRRLKALRNEPKTI